VLVDSSGVRSMRWVVGVGAAGSVQGLVAPLIFVRPNRADCRELLLSLVVSVSETYRRGSEDRCLDCFRFAA
jgi:hypothetical protein